MTGRTSFTADQAVTLDVAVPPTPSPTATATPSDPPNPSDPSDPSEMPATGTNVRTLVGLGLLMIAAGAAVTWLVRRRRVTAS